MADDALRTSLGAPTLAELSQTGSDLERARAGDRDAFDRLFRRFSVVVEVAVAARLRTELPALRARLPVEDAAQDVLTRAWQQLDRFEYRGPGSFCAWLRTVAARHVENLVKAARLRLKEQQEAAGDGATTGGVLERAAAPGIGIPTALGQQEERRRLVEALASLPEQDRAIVELHFFGGMEWNDLARELGLKSGDAARMALLRRVLPALKGALGAG